MSLMDILRQAGFSGSALQTAYAIAMAESGGNARAYNGNRKTGDNSFGLFQINMLGGMGPERRKQFGLSSNDDLYDPLTNAKVAYKMSQGGKVWTPWSTFNNDTYRKYLGQSGANVTGGAGGTATVTGVPPGAAAAVLSKPDIVHTKLTSFSPDSQDFSVSPQAFDQQQQVVPQQQVKVGGGGSSLRDKAIAAAMGVLGTPYSWGGGSTSGATRGFGRGANTVGFDCSSLMMYAYAQAGYSMPRTGRPQLALGKRVPISQLQPGDFLGWGNGHHIAMYLGNGQYIQAPSTGGHVEIKTLGKNSSAWGVHLNLPGD